MSLIRKVLILLPVFLIVFYVYRSFFSINSPLVWGDAPYFYSNSFIDNLGEPSSWVSKANNFGGPQTLFWISPLMFVYSVLGGVFSLNNDLIVRLLFYLPGLLLSLIGSYLLAKKFNLNILSSSICSFIYTVNTYSILLVDGGQVGVYLAYGLSPLLFLSFINLQNKFKRSNLLKFLFIAFTCSIADFRIAFSILFFSFLLYFLWKKRISIKAIFSIFALIPLFFYFLYPALSGMYENYLPVILDNRFFSFLNGLTLYQSHWPLNQYGLISYPNFLFGFIFVIISYGIFISYSKKWLSVMIIFLISIFLLKGETSPFGFVNSFLTSRLFFGFIFRDSSKFFIIALICSSLLISHTYQIVSERLFNFKYHIFYILLIFFTILIFPVMGNGLKGVLAQDRHNNNLFNVYKYLKTDKFTRVLWMPYFHPFTYHSENNQAISGRDLINIPIFKLINKGGDTFNYMYSFDFLNWFRFLGISNVVFSGVVKNIPLDINDKIDQTKILARYDSLGLHSLKIDSNKVYTIDNSENRIVGFNKIFLVIGEPYQINLPNKYPQLFFEDGIFKPFDPDEISGDSAEVIFNNAVDNDLIASLLQKDFLDTEKVVNNGWAIGNISNYLEWKYELLVRGFDLKNMIYNKSLFYSSNHGEKVTFNIKNKYKAGDYYFGIRTFSKGDSLKIKLGDELLLTNKNNANQLNWSIIKIKIDKNIDDLEIENNSDLSVLNTIFIASEKDYNQAVETSKKYTSKFKTYKISESIENKVVPAVYYDLDFKTDKPWRHFVNNNKNIDWMIFKDTYDRLWKLKNKDQLVGDSLPAYSFLNLFYIKPNWDKISIEYLGQDNFRIGLLVTTISIIVIIIVILILYEIDKDKRDSKYKDF